MHGNIVSPRGVGASDILMQPAFHLGVDDFRAGRPLRDDELPNLVGFKDTANNRQRIYETGRLVAAFARIKRRKIDASTCRAAKREGFMP